MIGYKVEEKKKKVSGRALNIFYTLFLPVFLLLIWEWAADTGRINGNVIPPPIKAC